MVNICKYWLFKDFINPTIVPIKRCALCFICCIVIATVFVVKPPYLQAARIQRIKVLHVMGAFLEKSLESHGFSHVFPLKFKGLLADSEKFPEFDVFVMFDKGLLQW